MVTQSVVEALQVFGVEVAATRRPAGERCVKKTGLSISSLTTGQKVTKTAINALGFVLISHSV